MELSKYIKSQSVELKRSAVHFADYNPRVISDEEKKTLKKGLKRFGLVGGVVVNKGTGLTVVSGHQRLSVMDELEKYNPDTKDNDYLIRVDVIDVDEKTEKELNLLMNNPNAQGKFDDEKLRKLIPEIDWQAAGLTETDLNLIGLDYLFKTEEETNISSALDDLMSEVNEEKEAAKEQRQLERAKKVAHMKDVKKQVNESAQQRAEEMEAYVMLSFDTYTAKASFMQRFDYAPDLKIIKGELFSEQVERIE